MGRVYGSAPNLPDTIKLFVILDRPMAIFHSAHTMTFTNLAKIILFVRTTDLDK